ncbi:hypothetical protein L7F22_051773 [Adiantum nelumboides]|nr:hypothetical protein [Adiantum nelumboides]
MASSSAKHQQLIMRLYSGCGLVSLPALSFLALVTGFTFSLSTLPSSLQALLPAMESLVLVSLPHLWRASLSWITPPCLFVLLNGIIMILTATSGRSSSSRHAGSSELEPTLASQTENVVFQQRAGSLVHGPVEHRPATSTTSATVLEDTLQIQGPLEMHMSLAHSLHIAQSAEQAAKLEPLREAACHDRYGDGEKQQLILYMNLQDVSASSSTAKIEQEHEATSDNPSTASSSVLACTCEEIIVKAGSEPSSPTFSTSSAAKNNTRRSMSIDSVSFVGNGEGQQSSEQLSEEAFKKIIDDFILKMNSKIRSETRVKN